MRARSIVGPPNEIMITMLALVMAASASAGEPECGHSPRLDIPAFALTVLASGKPAKVPATAYLRVIKMPYRKNLALNDYNNTQERVIQLPARYEGNVLRTEPVSIMLESYHIDDGVFFKTACYENLRAVVFGFNERPDPVVVPHSRESWSKSFEIPLTVTGIGEARMKEYLPARLSFGPEVNPGFADSFKHWVVLPLEDILTRPFRTVELAAAAGRKGRLLRRDDLQKCFLRRPAASTRLIPEYLPDSDRPCFELAAARGWNVRLMGRAHPLSSAIKDPDTGHDIGAVDEIFDVFELSDETVARCAAARKVPSAALDDAARRMSRLAAVPDWR